MLPSWLKDTVIPLLNIAAIVYLLMTVAYLHGQLVKLRAVAKYAAEALEITADFHLKISPTVGYIGANALRRLAATVREASDPYAPPRRD